jgi:hypothetical protein
MARINENELEMYLAALSLQEVMKILETSERNVRRFVAERGLYRRTDGKFPVVTTVWWWLGDYQRRIEPGGDPIQDLLLMSVRFFRMLGFREFNEDMVNSMEILLRVPITQTSFDALKKDWARVVRNS